MELTRDEYEAFFMVKNIVGNKICPERLTKSDAKTYLAVQIDNSARKTICRLYLMGRKKYIGTISSRKVETKSEIRSLDEIARYSTELTAIVRHYENM